MFARTHTTAHGCLHVCGFICMLSCVRSCDLLGLLIETVHLLGRRLRLCLRLRPSVRLKRLQQVLDVLGSHHLAMQLFQLSWHLSTSVVLDSLAENVFSPRQQAARLLEVDKLRFALPKPACTRNQPPNVEECYQAGRPR